MLILGIDTSAKTAACGICDETKTIVDFTLNHKRTHSEKIMEMIDTALSVAKLDITDIDAFAITKGPGSFTGLRIGLSTVKAICHALNKPCYTVSTLDALYEKVKESSLSSFYVLPMMDARRNEVYTALYKDGEKIIEDTALPAKEILEKVKDLNPEKILFTGDGVLPNKEEIIKVFGDKAYFVAENHSYSDGTSVIRSALKNPPANYDDILPCYLRLSQAERLKKGN